MTWKPEDLFKKGDGVIIAPVDGGFRTRRFIRGRCVGDTLTYQPARAAGVRLTTPVLSINRALDPADVARVERWLLGEMKNGGTAVVPQPANPACGVLGERAKTFTGWRPGHPEPAECHCDHKLQGTGAVFFQSVGILHCADCRGWQLIRKPVE